VKAARSLSAKVAILAWLGVLVGLAEAAFREGSPQAFGWAVVLYGGVGLILGGVWGLLRPSGQGASPGSVAALGLWMVGFLGAVYVADQPVVPSVPVLGEPTTQAEARDVVIFVDGLASPAVLGDSPLRGVTPGLDEVRARGLVLPNLWVASSDPQEALAATLTGRLPQEQAGEPVNTSHALYTAGAEPVWVGGRCPDVLEGQCVQVAVRRPLGADASTASLGLFRLFFGQTDATPHAALVVDEALAAVDGREDLFALQVHLTDLADVPLSDDDFSAYHAELRTVDAEIGRLLGRLRARGHRLRVWLIGTSVPGGTRSGDHAWRVPFLLSDDDRDYRGFSYERRFEQSDFFATLAYHYAVGENLPGIGWMGFANRRFDDHSAEVARLRRAQEMAGVPVTVTFGSHKGLTLDRCNPRGLPYGDRLSWVRTAGDTTVLGWGPVVYEREGELFWLSQEEGTVPFGMHDGACERSATQWKHHLEELAEERAAEPALPPTTFGGRRMRVPPPDHLDPFAALPPEDALGTL